MCDFIELYIAGIELSLVEFSEVFNFSKFNSKLLTSLLLAELNINSNNL